MSTAAISSTSQVSYPVTSTNTTPSSTTSTTANGTSASATASQAASVAAVNAATAALKEAEETTAQTALEAAKGDRQAQNLLAREQAATAERTGSATPSTPSVTKGARIDVTA